MQEGGGGLPPQASLGARPTWRHSKYSARFPPVGQDSERIHQGQILAEWILAAELPNFVWDFALDNWLEFFLLSSITIPLLSRLASKIVFSSMEKLYTPHPPLHFLARRHFSGDGGGWYILNPPASGILCPPPSFINPPPLEGSSHTMATGLVLHARVSLVRAAKFVLGGECMRRSMKMVSPEGEKAPT